MERNQKRMMKKAIEQSTQVSRFMGEKRARKCIWKRKRERERLRFQMFSRLFSPQTKTVILNLILCMHSKRGRERKRAGRNRT